MKKKQVSTLVLALFCYLGLHGGRIALYREPGGAPAYVFPYNAELLPLQDRQALETGIPCPDREELTRLLESYLS